MQPQHQGTPARPDLTQPVRHLPGRAVSGLEMMHGFHPALPRSRPV